MKNRYEVLAILPVFISIVLLSVSCVNQVNEEGPKTINIDIKKPTPSDALPKTAIKQIIPLDSRQSALFGNFKWYEVYENRIYVLSIIETYSLFVFSAESGQLIAKAKEGEGPDEISRPTACFIDKSKKQVMVYNETSSEIVIYDLDLNFLSRKKLEEYFIDDFIMVDDNLLLTSSDFTPDYCFRLYDEKDGLIGEFIRGNQIRNGSLNLMKSLAKKSKNDEALLITPFDYNIYGYRNKIIERSIYLNFGEYQLKEEDLKREFAAIISMVRDGSKVISPMSISTFDDLIVIRTFYRNSPIFYLINTSNYQVVRLNDLSLANDLPNFIDLSIMEDGFMYGLVEPIEMNTFMENTDLTIESSFDFDPVDNPYLLKIEIL